MLISSASASYSYSEVKVNYNEKEKVGKPVPIHTGAVLGIVNHQYGKGELNLAVRKNLVLVKPIMFQVNSSGGLKTRRVKVDSSNYFPEGNAWSSRGYVSISETY